jgi:diaminopimelate epimerase
VLGGQARDGLRISVGNPHLACLVDDALDKYDLAAPPALDPAQFPDGGNVELVRLTGPAAVAMRVHERGSGETRSCGTGAVAAAVAAAAVAGAAGAGTAVAGAAGAAAAVAGAAGAGTAAGGPDEAAGPRAWQVSVPGGDLTVRLGTATTWLTGPAVIVAEGEITPGWLAAQR